MAGREAFLFRLNKSQGNGLSIQVDFNSEDIVDFPASAASCLSADNLDRTSRFLSSNQILGPAILMDRRIDQFGPGIGFVKRHISFYF